MAAKTLDFNEVMIRNFIESLRPEDPETRKQLDYGYTYEKQVFILFSIRPFYADPSQKIESDFAKIRYYKSRDEWAVYWMRASGKWELYHPAQKFAGLADILREIKEDENGCFFG